MNPRSGQALAPATTSTQGTPQAPSEDSLVSRIISAVHGREAEVASARADVRRLQEERDQRLRQVDEAEESDRSRSIIETTEQRNRLKTEADAKIRAYDQQIRDLEEQRAATIRAELDAITHARDRVLDLPPSLRDTPPDAVPLAEASAEEYARMLAIAREGTVISLLKRLFTLGRHPTRSATAARYIGMTEAQVAKSNRIIAATQSDTGAIDRLMAQKRRVEADLRDQCDALERSSQAPGSYERDRRQIAMRYDRAIDMAEAKVASLEDMTPLVAGFRQECSALAQELACTPRDLMGPYSMPTDSHQRLLFDFWVRLPFPQDQILCPYCSDLRHPTNYILPQSQLPAVRSMVAYRLRMLPKGMLSVVWLDPYDMGRTLTQLAPLATGPSWQNMISVGASAQDIDQQLTDIHERLRKLNLLVTGEGGLWMHNANPENEPVPYTLIVALGIDGPRYSDASLQTLYDLMRSQSTLGLQIVATHDDGSVPSMASSHESDGRGQVIGEVLQNMTPLSTERGATVRVDGVELGTYLQGDQWVTPRFVSDFLSATDTSSTFQRKSTKRIVIPFGKTVTGQDALLDFGEYAHMFLAGITGSGKSFFLHNAVCKACSIYSPQELAIWLVDYKKTEFGIYIRDRSLRLPHIRFIGIDNNKDFVRALMEHAMAEFNDRQNKISTSGARNITEYNAKVPESEHLPQLLIIMDEFHRQSALTDYHDQSATDLEMLLREGRAFGMHFLIADQGIGNLQGLSEAAKLQLGGRIILGWAERTELTDMFEGQSFDIEVNSLQPGQALMRSHGQVTLCNWPRWELDDTREVVEESLRKWGANTDGLLIHDSSTPHVIRPEDLPDPHNGDLPVGLSANFIDPMVAITLSRRRRENVFVLNKNEDLTMRLAYALATGYARGGNGRKVVLVTAEGDSLYDNQQPWWDDLTRRIGLRVLFGARGLCDLFSDGQVPQSTMLLLTGLDIIADDLMDAPARDGAGGGGASAMGALADFMALGDELGIRTKSRPDAASQPKPGDGVYDARSDLIAMMRSGGMSDSHVCLIAEDVPSLYTQLGPQIGQDDLKTLCPIRVSPYCAHAEAYEIGIPAATDIPETERNEKLEAISRKGQITEFTPYDIQIG